MPHKVQIVRLRFHIHLFIRHVFQINPKQLLPHGIVGIPALASYIRLGLLRLRFRTASTLLKLRVALPKYQPYVIKLILYFFIESFIYFLKA